MYEVKVKVKYEGVLVVVVVVVVVVMVVVVVVVVVVVLVLVLVVVQLHSFITLAPDCGERLTLRPGSVTPKKEPRCPLNRRLGGPQKC